MYHFFKKSTHFIFLKHRTINNPLKQNQRVSFSKHAHGAFFVCHEWKLILFTLNISILEKRLILQACAIFFCQSALIQHRCKLHVLLNEKYFYPFSKLGIDRQHQFLCKTLGHLHLRHIPVLTNEQLDECVVCNVIDCMIVLHMSV